MKNYEHYTAEDFIRDEGFRNWVQGCSDDENFWLSFLHKYPDKKAAIRQAEQVIRATHSAEEVLTAPEIRQEIETFLSRAIDQQPPLIESGSGTSGFGRFIPWQVLKYIAAAMAAMALGLTWYAMRYAPSAQEMTSAGKEVSAPTAQLVHTSNPTSEPLHLRLDDDSEVVLSPHSTLSYPAQFSDTARMVYLTGEASFSVQRQERPFVVVTGEMITKVLGTRFVVRAFENDPKFTVQVVSGKVSVSRAESNREAGSREVNGLILTANQAAIYEKNVRHLTKTLVANPLVVEKITANPEKRYDEVALPVMLYELENLYGIAIEFDEQNFQNCRITATLSDETLYEKLDILCKTISASYEIVDGQIVLSGKGCR